MLIEDRFEVSIEAGMLQYADRFALLQPSPKDGLVEIQTQAVPSQPDGFGEMLRRKRIGKMTQERPSGDDTRRGHRDGHKVFELAAVERIAPVLLRQNVSVTLEF